VPRQVLAGPSLWSNVSEAQDPFDDRPDAVDCPSSSWAVEVDTAGEPAFELDTGQCDYATFHQVSLADVQAGGTVGLSWGHSALTADEPASAHISLRLDTQVLWDSTVAIPADADQTGYEQVLSTPVPAGADLWAHLHNHGDNTWNLGEIWTRPAGGSP